MPIKIDGVVYATPEKFIQHGTALYGLFLADDDAHRYDEWLYWGEATSENLEAIRRAGVRIDVDTDGKLAVREWCAT